MRIALVALMIAGMFMAGISQAVATRPLPMQAGDKCWNLPGVQDRIEFSLDVVRWKVKTGEKGDCRYVNHLSIH